MEVCKEMTLNEAVDYLKAIPLQGVTISSSRNWLHLVARELNPIQRFGIMTGTDRYAVEITPRVLDRLVDRMRNFLKEKEDANGN